MRRMVMGLLVVGFASVGPSGFAHAADWGGYKVGHRKMSVTLTDSAGMPRPLVTLIWYPADPKSYKDAPPSTYKPLLHGVALPAPWAALSWEFAAERARENPVDVCPCQFFLDPVDITGIVEHETGVLVTSENVPTSIALAAVNVMVSDLARAFFGDVLDVRGDESFGEYLIDEFQEKYGENLTTVELSSWH